MRADSDSIRSDIPLEIVVVTNGEGISETVDVASFENGVAGEIRGEIPGYDTGIMLLVLGVLIFALVNFRHYSTLIKTFGQDLISVRKRENAFDNHTLNETRIIGSLIISLCLCEGILCMSFLGFDRSGVLGLLVMCAGCGGLYAFQYCAYSTVGYTFSTSSYRRQWLRCFNATQSLLGLCLVVPSLTLLFNPGLRLGMTMLGAFFYVLFRILFIIKGFRIFYHNLFSVIYFILYLCALEIVPLLLFYKCSDYFSLI